MMKINHRVKPKNKVDSIIIVGYPKTGTTWLTRLIAQSLQARVPEYDFHNSYEVASDVNTFIKGNNNLKIIKAHDLPAFFDNHSNNKYIYITRSIKPLILSNYLYFNSFDENELKVTSIFSLFSNRRIDFFIYCIRFLFNSKKRMSYFNHIKEWRSTNKDVCFTTYENLISNTKNELIRIFKELKIEYKEIEVDKAINNQKFSVQKERRVEKNSKIHTMINKKHMRKGTNNDWRQYFSIFDLFITTIHEEKYQSSLKSIK